MESTKARTVRISARVAATAVFLLLIAGALVTSTESGLAVPDWPLAYGKLMPPMVGGILYEHGHRMIAALVSFFVGLQAGILLWGEPRRSVKRLGLLAFAAILAQALLGGLTVLLLLPPAVSSAHAGLAQIVFALASAIALMTTRSWTSGEITGSVSPSDAPALRQAFVWTVAATAATYLQILLGAVMRHTGAGLAIPDFPLAFGGLVPSASEFTRPGVPIHFAHRVGAAVVTVLILFALRASFRLRDRLPLVSSLSAWWAAALALQLTLGTFSIWTRKAAAVTAAHLAVGALVWVTGVLLALTLGRARATALAALASRSRESSPAALPSASMLARLADYVALTKPRITLFVVLTAFVGFAAGTPGRLDAVDLLLLVHTLLGTALVASGTSAFNQLSEIVLDGRMRRTAERPLPAGRISPAGAFLRDGPLRRRGRRAGARRQRTHGLPRRGDARQLRLPLHADEDGLAPLDDRRRRSGRAPAARRVHGRPRRGRGTRPRSLRAPFPLAAPAFLRHRMAPSGRLRRRRSPDPPDARPDGTPYVPPRLLLVPRPSPGQPPALRDRDGRKRLRLRRPRGDAPFPRGLLPLRARRDGRAGARPLPRLDRVAPRGSSPPRLRPRGRVTGLPFGSRLRS